MGSEVKILVGEVDGQEYDVPTERLLESKDCKFSNYYFGAVDAEEAIIEASKPLIPIFMLQHNSNIGNNDWINFSNLTPNAKLVIPFDLTIEKLTWGNSNSSIDCDWKIYKNGITEADLCNTLEFRNTPNDYGSYDCSIDFNEGDWVRILYVDQGTNMNDLNAVIWGRRR